MSRSERSAIRKALTSTANARAAAAALKIGYRTLLRRMREYGLEVAPRGRPRRRQVRFTSFQDVLRDEGRYWRACSGEERFHAVEVIREAAYALYHGRKLPRLERVYRFADAPSRAVHHRGRARTGGAR